MDIRKHSQTSNIIRLILSSSVTGLPLTGLTFESAGLIISTIADNEATATAYTGTAGNVETIATLGTFAAPTASKCRFKEVDSTNHPGLYEIQIANARFAVASAKKVVISVLGASNLKQENYEICLSSYDPFDAVRMGMTALPNAAAEAEGGLYTRGTGAGQIAQDASGNIRANLDTIKTQAVSCGAAVTVLASVGTAATSTAQTGDSFARLGAPAGASIAADIAAVLAAIPAAVWNYLVTALTTAGSIGKRLADWLTVTPSSATAYGATDLEICNNALVLLGNNPLADLTDTTKKAVKIVTQFYTQAIEETLRAYTWNCAITRDTLTADGTAPEFGYSYRFAVPADCLRVLMVYDADTKFKVENGYILTDDSGGEVQYIKLIGVDDMDALCRAALTARLASMIAFPLTNSVSVAEAMWKMYKDRLDEAQTVDAFEGSSEQMASDNWVNSRL